MNVYIRGSSMRASAGDGASSMIISLPLLSKAVLLFTQYPSPVSDINVHIVLEQVSPENTILHFPSLNNPQVHFSVQSHATVPAEIAAIDLPVFKNHDRVLVYSGFSAVIRALVQNSTSYLEEVHKNTKTLLGLNQSCLKACKEKSKWSMLCEDSLPDAVVRAHFHSHRDNGSVVPDAHVDSSFHSILTDLENNLYRRNAKSVPNESGKMQPFLEGKHPTLVDVLCYFYLHQLGEPMVVSTLLHSYVGLTKWWKNMQFLSTTLLPLDAHFHLYNEAAASPLSDSLLSDQDAWKLKALSGKDKYEFSLAKGIERLLVTKKNTGDLADVVKKVRDMLDDSQTMAETLLRAEPMENAVLFHSWDDLPACLRIEETSVPSKRHTNKRQQLGNLISLALKHAQPGDFIMDFCSGCGYLGLILAYLLPQCTIVLLENKEESLHYAETCWQRLRQESGQLMHNVRMYKGNLVNYSGPIQLGVALHACGAVTDLVMDMCLLRGAKFIISPCCYGSIKPNSYVAYPRSGDFVSNVTLSEYSKLCHSADLHDGRTSRLLLGREAMNLVDVDRLLYAAKFSCKQSKNSATTNNTTTTYRIGLVKMNPQSCTPKNNILIGQPVLAMGDI